MIRWMKQILVSALLPLALACGGGGGTVGGGGPQPGFTLGLSASNLIVTQGQSGSLTVDVLATGGFTGVVALSVQGAPPGVTPAITSLTATRSQLTLQVAGAAAAGTSSLSVTGTSGGLPTQIANLTLVVNPASTPGFSLSVNPGSLSLAQGGSGTTVVSIAPTGGFTGTVNLNATGLPTGAIATFTPNSATATSTFGIQVGASVTPGPYSVTVRGNSAGLPEQTTSFTLTVTSGGGGSATPLNWNLCLQGQDVVWFAYQDGSGPWQVVQPVGSTYSFSVASGKAGVAIVFDAGGMKLLSLIYATTNEFTQKDQLLDLSLKDFFACGSTGTVAGTAAGIPLGTTMVPVSIGEAIGIVPSGQNAFSISGVRPGTHDLMTSINTIAGSTWTTGKIILRRGVNVVAPGTTNLTLDFGTEGFMPVIHTAIIAGVGAGEVATSGGSFYSTSGLFAGYTSQGIPGGLLTNGQSVQFAGIPPDRQQSSDVHGIFATAAPLNGMAPAPDNTRWIQQFFHTAADLTLTIPGAHPLPSIQKVTGTPYLRSQISWTVAAPYTKFWTYSLMQNVATPSLTRTYSVMMTAGYAGGAAALSHTLPDFSSLPGWNNVWALQDGVQVEGIFAADGWTSSLSTIAPARIDGEKYFGAVRKFTFNP